jgi:serine protease Do
VQSVVNISTSRTQRRTLSAEEELFRRFWGLRGGDREAQRSASLGSGVIVSGDGVVLTNNHVIEGADQIRVKLASGKEVEAKLVGADPRADLAVLRLQGTFGVLQPIALADSDQLRLGEVVLAIGSPFGLAQSVSMGIVSAKGRADVHIADYEDFVQTDAAINPGNSGGALVNLRGELVGINTAIASSSGGSQGIGFAIPTNMARPIMKSLLDKGRVVRGWLGVGIQALTDELRQAFAAGGQSGVLITEVMASSPADKAGIRRGDVVLRVATQTVDSPQRLRNVVSQAQADAKVRVDLLRDGKAMSVDVTLGEAPDPRAAAQHKDTQQAGFGLELADLSADVRLTRGLPDGLRGVWVRSVASGSAAERAGIEAGDVVLEMDRRGVDSATALARALGGAQRATLLVWRDGNARYVSLQR